MSAKSQAILEKINEVEELIRVTDDAGNDTTVFKHQLKELFEQLKASNETLNEGKFLIKG